MLPAIINHHFFSFTQASCLIHCFSGCFNAEHLFGGIALFCLLSLRLPFKTLFTLRKGLAVNFWDFSCFSECLAQPLGTQLALS